MIQKLADGAEIELHRSGTEAVIYRFFQHGLRDAVLGIKRGR